jgi:hypothetical protein
MPEDIQRILMSYLSCESSHEARFWDSSVADVIIDAAKILPPEQGFYFSERAYCPLCGQGSSSPYESGFSVPEGLRRHLVGWGNTYQCKVMKTALGLARDYWDERFREADQAEEVAKRKRLEERKRTETLYRTAPDGDPQLIDEWIWFGTKARDHGQLAWAEARLNELGFATLSEGNVTSYLSERGDFVIYADPRGNGRIIFNVYKKPNKSLSQKGRKPRVRIAPRNTFYLQDNWRNDIFSKYETRLNGAMEALS